MFDEVDDFEVYKMLKKLFTNPFSLKSLARIQIRKELTNINKENVEQFKNLSEDLKNFLLFN